MDIAEKTLKKIEEENIKPEPRWHFILRDCSLWAAFVGSIFIGAIAVSAIIFMLTDQDWNIYKILDRSLFKHILISLPYLWILVLLILVLVAYCNFKLTKDGYKYEMHRVAICSILISLVLGFVLFVGGLGEIIHNILSNQVPFYNNLVYDRGDVWDRPDKGLLSGKILEINQEAGIITVRDFNGKIWKIKNEIVRYSGPSFFQIGDRIKIIGTLGPDMIFMAEEIDPWAKIKPR